MGNITQAEIPLFTSPFEFFADVSPFAHVAGI